MSTWKSLERRIAAMLDGERVPVTGRTGEKGQETPDIKSDYWALEVKHRSGKVIADWQVDAMKQAKASYKEGQHIAPVVILHRKSMRLDDCICMMPLKYLIKIQRLLEERAEP